jgi:predicted nucleic acid-binding Zn ribbon protein
MPIYEYRCECGEVLEALVRGGREPKTGAEIRHHCDSRGTLTRLVSAPNVASGAGMSLSDIRSTPAPAAESCGSCGRIPGSCEVD